MDYISVKEAAELFNLSERRVQKLCETNRIKGCKMVSGIWLIPATAQKPVDERFSDIPEDSDYYSLKDLCDALSISLATGRNWIKLKKIIPEYTNKKTPYFTKDYVNILKSEIQTGKNQALKSRRNKKFVSGNSLYNSYISENSKNIDTFQNLLEIAHDECIEFSIEVIQYIVADCALHLFAQKNNLFYKNKKSLLSMFLKKEIILETYSEFIHSLIEDTNKAIHFCETYPQLFSFDYI